MFNPVFDHLSNTSCFITNFSATQEVDDLIPLPLSIVPVPVRTIHHTRERTPQKKKTRKVADCNCQNYSRNRILPTFPIF